MAKERSEAITTEVSKLVKARILKAVFFPKWVSNPVMVKKTDGTWRMCIDFTSLNKACPKDSYPFPEIDQQVESLEGFKMKCFLDAYKGYHQIRMAREEAEKTSFHTEHDTFCYEKMPFGLKNNGATYQRLMDNMFTSQLGQNIEVYVDDMVIKRNNEGSLIIKITKTFDTLKKANMKLNSKKSTIPTVNNLQTKKVISTPGKSTSTWTLFTDGASSIEGSGVGLSGRARAHDSDGSSVFGSIHGFFVDNKPSKRFIRSQEDIMRRYLVKVRELQGHFNNFTITRIPMSKNKRADALSKLASSLFVHLTNSVLVEVVPRRSIEVKAINTIKEVGVDPNF
nr:reverse transcriptase domain-containing protein [Tanacetum cinerariifolium]